jgi:hypothetical protein
VLGGERHRERRGFPKTPPRRSGARVPENPPTASVSRVDESGARPRTNSSITRKTTNTNTSYGENVPLFGFPYTHLVYFLCLFFFETRYPLQYHIHDARFGFPTADEETRPETISRRASASARPLRRTRLERLDRLARSPSPPDATHRARDPAPRP